MIDVDLMLFVSSCFIHLTSDYEIEAVLKEDSIRKK